MGYYPAGLPWWLSGKESHLQCRRPRFNPWVKKIPWRKKWQPTPVLLSGKFHGQRSLAGYSPWDHKELDMTERLTLSLFPYHPSAEWWVHSWVSSAKMYWSLMKLFPHCTVTNHMRTLSLVRSPVLGHDSALGEGSFTIRLPRPPLLVLWQSAPFS